VGVTGAKPLTTPRLNNVIRVLRGAILTKVCYAFVFFPEVDQDIRAKGMEKALEPNLLEILTHSTPMLTST
jgi:hypothetical protein